MSADHRYMARALRLAQRGRCNTEPNPTVGCVIVSAETIVGEGFTQPAGGNHAEIEALAAAGERAAGSTAYVSLEPCAHQGRTGPCVKALIDSGIARVVYAIEDPNPAVAGRGRALLAAAGVEVDSGPLADAAYRVNRGYFSRMQRGRPWIRLKMAASLDGKTALANGQSQWITGPAARRDVHRWRAQSSAIMTGIGTILGDDPALTARPDNLDVDVKQPMRVIVDSRLRTPPSAKTLTLPGRVMIFTGIGNANAELDAAGAVIEAVAADPRCDLAAIVVRLAELECNDVWLEAGPMLSGAMLTAGLVDEIILYLAPSILGNDARDMLILPALDDLDARTALRIDEFCKVGQDLRIIAHPVAH